MRHLIDPTQEEFEELCGLVQATLSDSIAKHEDQGLRIKRMVCAVLDGRNEQQLAEVKQELDDRAATIRFAEETDDHLADSRARIDAILADINRPSLNITGAARRGPLDVTTHGIGSVKP